MTTSPETRYLTLPPTGVWKVDPGHAEIGFSGRHLMLTRVRGRFTGVEATVTISEDPSASAVEATIDMSTVSSGDTARDDHLRSADFFDVAAHPTAHFRSIHFAWDGQRGGRLNGELTIKGVTRPVELDVTYLGSLKDPWENERAVFDAVGRIDREDWGLTWNMPLASGGLLVSREIDLELHVELVRER